MDNQKMKVLEKLYRTIKDSIDEEEGDFSIEAMLIEDSKDHGGVPVLTTLHHSFGTESNLAEGEFYFTEDIFVAKVILVPQVPLQNQTQLCVLMSFVGAILPAGSFEFDTSQQALVYCLKTPVYEGLSDEELFDFCDRCIGIALSVAEENSYDLIKIAKAS